MEPMIALVQQMMQFMVHQEELRATRYAQDRHEEAAQKWEAALIAARERRGELAQLRADALVMAHERQEEAAVMREEALRATQERRKEIARLLDLLTKSWPPNPIRLYQ